jgi:hypothetical protein
MVGVKKNFENQDILGCSHNTYALGTQVNKRKRCELELLQLPKYNPHVSEAKSEDCEVK